MATRLSRPACQEFRSRVSSFRLNLVGTINHVIYHRRWAWSRSYQRSINQRNHFLLGSSYV